MAVVNPQESELFSIYGTPPAGGGLLDVVAGSLGGTDPEPSIRSREVVRDGQYVIEYYDIANPTAVLQTVDTGRFYNPPGVSGGVSQNTIYLNQPGTNQSRYNAWVGDNYMEFDTQDPTYQRIVATRPASETAPRTQIVNGNVVDFTDPSNPIVTPIPGMGGGGPDFEMFSATGARPYTYNSATGQWEQMPFALSPYGGASSASSLLNSGSSGGLSNAMMALLSGSGGGGSSSGGYGGISLAAQNASSLAQQGAENEQSLAYLQAKNNLNLQYQQQLEAIRNSGGSASASQREQMLWQANENALDRAQQLAIEAARLGIQQGQLDLQTATAFRESMSSVDPGAVIAFMKAYGTIGAGLAQGGTALSDAAMLPSAMLMQQMGGGLGGGTGIPGAGGLPGGGGGLPGGGGGIPRAGGQADSGPDAEGWYTNQGTRYRLKPDGTMEYWNAPNPQAQAARPVPLTFEAWLPTVHPELTPVPGRPRPNPARDPSLNREYAAYLESMAPPVTPGTTSDEYLRRSLGMSTADFYGPGWGDMRAGGGNVAEANFQAQYAGQAGPRPQNTGQGENYGYDAAYRSWIDQQMQRLREQAASQLRQGATGLRANEIDPYSMTAEQRALVQQYGLRIFQDGVGQTALDPMGQTFAWRPGTTQPLNEIGGNGQIVNSFANPLSQPISTFGGLSPQQLSGMPAYAQQTAVKAATPTYQAGYPSAPNPETIPYGNDQIINGIPQPMAKGGVAKPGLPILVGDSPTGKPNPEIIYQMGNGTQLVRPVSQATSRLLQQAGRGMADGGIIDRTKSPLVAPIEPVRQIAPMPEPLGSRSVPEPAPMPTTPVGTAIPYGDDNIVKQIPARSIDGGVVQAPTNPITPQTSTLGGGIPVRTTQAAIPNPPPPTAPVTVNNLPPVTQWWNPSMTGTGQVVIPPSLQQYLADIRAQRETTPFEYISPYFQDYERMNPYALASSELGLQAARGIPQALTQWEQQRFRLPGTRVGALSQGL